MMMKYFADDVVHMEIEVVVALSIPSIRVEAAHKETVHPIAAMAKTCKQQHAAQQASKQIWTICKKDVATSIDLTGFMTQSQRGIAQRERKPAER